MNDDTPSESSGAFDSDLLPGEHILWTGRPTQRYLFKPTDLGFIPFSVVFLGATVWMLANWAAGAERPIYVGTALFILIAVGLYVTVGRFLHDIWVRNRTYYAITDRRVLSRREIFGMAVDTQDIRNLRTFRMHEGKDGFGSIEFERITFWPWIERGAEIVGPGLRPGVRFLGIDDVRAVYDLIAREQVKPRS